MNGLELTLAPAAPIVGTAWADGWAPPASIKPSEWAEANIHVGGVEKGPYSTARTPYAREPMDCLAIDSPVQDVALIWAAQTGKSQIINNLLGYWARVEPAPIMLVQPTLNVAKRYSHRRIAPLIANSPALREVFATRRSRDEASTTLMKEFTSGVLVIAGANAAADLRSMDVRYELLDEIDAYPQDVDGEGDPIELARGRQTTYEPVRKTLYTSTPTDELSSRIKPLFTSWTQEYFHVPCPFCGHHQRLEFARLKWEPDAPDAPWYECAGCNGKIDERHKATMLPAGVWVADNPGAGGGTARSFHLSGLYSPLGWYSWRHLVRAYLKAEEAKTKGDTALWKPFLNMRLAETYKEAADTSDPGKIKERAEAYALRTPPAEVGILTAACDVQGNRIELLVIGWGEGEESWVIDRAVFWGDPAELLSGKDSRLDDALRTVYRNVHGAELRIVATAIDSGGHYTHDVYMFCRQRRHRHIFAVKGESRPSKPVLGKPTPVDIDYRGSKVKGGAQLWFVGSDTGKELVYNRLRIEAAGPGCIHHSTELDGDFYDQLCSEVIRLVSHRGRTRREWVLPAGRRNEALDMMVYNVAAAIYAGIPRMTAARWDELRRTLGPSLFTGPVAEPAAATDAPAPAASPAPVSAAPLSEQPTASAVPTPVAPRAPTPARSDWLGDRTRDWLKR